MPERNPPRTDALSELAAALEKDGAAPAAGDEIEMILRADELTKSAHARLHELVAVARDRDISWLTIGDALGVSRQAAFKRFSTPRTDERTDMAQPTIDLIDRTSEVFARLDVGDYDGVKAYMTYTCARALTKRKLMIVWSDVASSSGRLEECVDSTVQTSDGTNTLGKFANRMLLNGAVVVQTTLRHEAGERLGRVAYNGFGKITGLLIAPPESRDLPF